MRKWLRPLPVWVSLAGLLALGGVWAPAPGLLHEVWYAAAICLPSLILVLAVHEFGHWVGGYIAGFRFFQFTLGPVKVVRTGQGLRLGVNDAWLPFASVCAAPVDMCHLNRGCAMVSAAGPVANLLLAGMLGGPFLARIVLAPRPEVLIRHVISHWGGEYWFLAVCEITFMSLAFGLVNLIPFHEAYYTSDGGRLLLLWRGGPKADRLAANIGVLAASMSGQRPREWDPGLIARGTRFADGSVEQGIACMFAYARALDVGDCEIAGVHLQQGRAILAKVPFLKGVIGFEAAYFEARFGREPARARALLDSARRENRDRDAHLVAEVAVLLAEGRAAEARARVPEALAALRREHPVEAGVSIMYAEWLRAVGAGITQPR